MKKKYIVLYDKDEHRWGVYSEDVIFPPSNTCNIPDWLCDCLDKDTAKEIAAALKQAVR